jgi:hypothetical protein
MALDVRPQLPYRFHRDCGEILMRLLGRAAVFLLRNDQVRLDPRTFNRGASAAFPRNALDQIAIIPIYFDALPHLRILLYSPALQPRFSGDTHGRPTKM